MKNLLDIGMRKRYLLSFVVSSIVPLLVLISLSYSSVVNIFKNESVQSEQTKINRIREIVDTRADEIYNVSVQMSLDKRIKLFLYKEQPLDIAAAYSMKDVSDIINAYQAGNKFVDMIAVYFIQSKLVFTREGRYDADYFFSQVLRYKDEKPSDTRKAMEATAYNKYIPLKAISGNGTLDGRYVTYLQSLPIGDKQASASIIMLVKENSLLSAIGELKQEQNERVIVLNSDDLVISSSDGNSELYGHVKKKMENGNEMFTIDTPDNKRKIVSYTQSNVNGWNYILISDVNSAVAKISKTMYIGILIAFLSFAVAIVISVFMAKINYSPWEELKKFIGSTRYKANGVNDDDKCKNEYLYTKDTIVNMLVERDKLQSDMDKRKYYIKSYIIQHLCEGKTVPKDITDQVPDVVFPYRNFCVIYIDFENDVVIPFSILTFLSKLIGIYYNNCVIYPFEDKKGRFCIALNSDLSKSDLLVSHVKNLRDNIGSHFETVIYVGIGNIYDSVDGLSLSYTEAKKSLEYSFLKGKEPVIFFPEIEIVIFSSLNLPVHSDNPLMNSLKAGDYKVCSKLLDEYFTGIASAGSSSIQYMYCLFYNFVSVAIKTCDNIHVDFKDIMQQDIAQILDIGRYRNTMQMIDCVYNIYLIICNHIQKNKVSYNSGLKMQIEKFINNYYSSTGISMIELTEKLGYSSSYLCRFIKQQFGMGFSDLLNKTRLDAAKNLLSTTQYQIKEISTKVGYSSINSFIRTFKQIEGVTPGQYREIFVQNNITSTV